LGIKHLHRLIVNPTTSGKNPRTPELYAKDNIPLLARGPRFRVEGEIVRDIARGDERPSESAALGGPSVFRHRRASCTNSGELRANRFGNDATGPDRYAADYTPPVRSVPSRCCKTSTRQRRFLLRRRHDPTRRCRQTTLNESFSRNARQGLSPARRWSMR